MASKHRAAEASAFRPGRLGWPGLVAMFGAMLSGDPAVRAQTPAAAPPVSGVPSSPEENLTVHGQRPHFEAAPTPGAPLGPPPANPTDSHPHLGRFAITGKQGKRDGYDTQTGAYIAPFGNAYTQAGPVADGLASRFGH